MADYVYKCPGCEHEKTITHTVAECDEPHYCYECETRDRFLKMERVLQVPLAVYPDGMTSGLTVSDAHEKQAHHVTRPRKPKQQVDY